MCVFCFTFVYGLLFVDLTRKKGLLIHEKSFEMRIRLMTESAHPEVTLCGWPDIKNLVSNEQTLLCCRRVYRQPQQELCQRWKKWTFLRKSRTSNCQTCPPSATSSSSHAGCDHQRQFCRQHRCRRRQEMTMWMKRYCWKQWREWTQNGEGCGFESLILTLRQ